MDRPALHIVEPTLQGSRGGASEARREEVILESMRRGKEVWVCKECWYKALRSVHGGNWRGFAPGCRRTLGRMKGGDSWLKAGKSSLWKEASKERLRVRREHA